MKNLIVFGFLLAGFVCTAQKKHITYFLKNNGQQVATRDSADYLRVIEEPDSGSKLYNVFEYYISGKKKSIGRSARIDMPLYEGQRITFDSSGIKSKISTYGKDHSPVGDEYLFYPNGKVHIILRYRPGAIEGSEPANELIMACYDSTGVALAENGNGSFKLYDYWFKKIVETGTVKEGKRDGKCEGLADMRKGHFFEEYKDGRLISGLLIDSAGKTVSNYSDARLVEPAYPGGLKAFNRYLRRNMHYPKPDKENNISGVVLLNFIIEKDGKVTSVRALNHVSPLIDAEAVRVMNSSPPWIPGSRYGLQVRVMYSLPIGFSLQDEDD